MPPLDRIDSFEQRVRESWPAEKWSSVSILLAVSGGPDSVALLRALDAIRKRPDSGSFPVGRFEVAHFNHRWRDSASDEDEVFVTKLCNELDVRLHVGRTQQTQRTEEAARNERYAFLRQTAEQRGARYLVTAHTANDVAETILHRVLRGTGLRGLRGIQFARRLSPAVTLIRPLLWANREDVMDYLKRLGQPYRIDSSNEDCSYTRNRIRHELIPELAQNYNPAILDSLLRLGTFAAEAINELEPIVAARAEACCLASSELQLELEIATLNAESEFMQREILVHLWRNQRWPEQAMSFEHWRRMVHAIQCGSTECFPGGVRVSVVNGRALLEQIHDKRDGQRNDRGP